MKVVFSRRALDHIDRLHLYITESSYETRADAYVERIVACCLDLSTFPVRGVARDDLMPGLRVIGFERRVSILFTVADECVVIEGIYYGGRSYAADFIE